MNSSRSKVALTKNWGFFRPLPLYIKFNYRASLLRMYNLSIVGQVQMVKVGTKTIIVSQIKYFSIFRYFRKKGQAKIKFHSSLFDPNISKCYNHTVCSFTPVKNYWLIALAVGKFQSPKCSQNFGHFEICHKQKKEIYI